MVYPSINFVYAYFVMYENLLIFRLSLLYLENSRGLRNAYITINHIGQVREVAFLLEFGVVFYLELEFVFAQIVKNEGSPIGTFDNGFYVIDLSDHENKVKNFIADDGTRILDIFQKKIFFEFFSYEISRTPDIHLGVLGQASQIIISC